VILVDVNILVYAARQDSDRHADAKQWLTAAIDLGDPIGISELIVGSAIRILTNPRIFKLPTSLDDAFDFVERLRTLPQAAVVAPGERHWNIFERLCRESGASGNLITDAYFAALAIEHDCEWVSVDRDFERFTGLRLLKPF